MSVLPTSFRSVTNLKTTVGNSAVPKSAVTRYPLLCAPYRAQRWVTGNAMGCVTDLLLSGTSMSMYPNARIRYLRQVQPKRPKR